MARIVRTAPEPVQRTCRPACAGFVERKEWHSSQLDENGKIPCARVSSYRVDGVDYCTVHAQQKALQILMKMEE